MTKRRLSQKPRLLFQLLLLQPLQLFLLPLLLGWRSPNLSLS
jgi:hypothetical protein